MSRTRQEEKVGGKGDGRRRGGRGGRGWAAESGTKGEMGVAGVGDKENGRCRSWEKGIREVQDKWVKEEEEEDEDGR